MGDDGPCSLLGYSSPGGCNPGCHSLRRRRPIVPQFSCALPQRGDKSCGGPPWPMPSAWPGVTSTTSPPIAENESLREFAISSSGSGWKWLPKLQLNSSRMMLAQLWRPPRTAAPTPTSPWPAGIPAPLSIPAPLQSRSSGLHEQLASTLAYFSFPRKTGN